MPEITINGQVIDFPESAASPNWSEAIIQFAQAVEGALSLSGGTYDVSPQTMNIAAYNSATNQDITSLSFPIASVRSVFIKYYVYRTTSSANAYESGEMIAMYNANNATNSKWALGIGNRVGDGASITFSMTDAGQMRFTTTALAGSSHAGRIGFEARALEQT